MKKNVLSHYDIAERQQAELGQLLSRSKVKEKTPSLESHENVPSQAQLNRDQTRVLFISRDEGILGEGQSIDGYVNLGEVFDEVHIVLLRTSGVPVRFPILRMSPKVWLYIISAKDWWRTPFKALSVIDEHLVFAGGFRPDIIIAHDPFESALVATIAGKRYNRPYQIHIQHDFYQPKFLITDTHPRLRRLLARYNLRRVQSVRTASDQITQMVHFRFSSVPDVATFPRFNKYEASVADPVAYDLKKLYPKFTCIILYVGSLNHDNLVHQVIDGIRPVCESINIGLVILGAGPAKAELEKRVKHLHLEQHVVFETTATRQTDYLKTADILVVTDPAPTGDELVIQGAVLHTALVATPTTVRTDIFTHDSSILFFEPGKSAMIESHLFNLVNDRAGRVLLAEAGRRAVSMKLHTNPEAYRYEYRKSIEQVLFIDEVPTKDNAQPESKKTL